MSHEVQIGGGIAGIVGRENLTICVVPVEICAECGVPEGTLIGLVLERPDWEVEAGNRVVVGTILELSVVGKGEWEGENLPWSRIGCVRTFGTIPYGP